MKRKNCIPYVKIELSLFGCIEDGQAQNFLNNLKNHLIQELQPDFKSDIELSIVESAGLTEEELKSLSED
jgi:hypothetical protein